jgi:hypothetical protein
MQIQAGLTQVKARLDDAMAELEAAQEKVRRLEVMRDGLELAVTEFESFPAQDETADGDREPAEAETRHAVEPVGHEPVEQPRQSLRGIADGLTGEVTNTALAEASVTALDRVAMTNEIRARMSAAGYDRSYEQVRGALTWLAKQGRVRHVGAGAWAPPEKAPQHDFTPAISVAGVSEPSANGHVPPGAH